MLEQRPINSHPQLRQIMQEGRHSSVKHNLADPFLYNSTALDGWIALCDFYTSMPLYQTFNSLEDLLNKLSSRELMFVSEKIRLHNIHRAKELVNRWRHFFSGALSAVLKTK